jgi:cytochrome bd-type quinol oxidase subunit 1
MNPNRPYTVFAIVEIFLMLHFIRKGPEEHGPEPVGRASPVY